MTDKASPALGWLVVVRVWNTPDEHYFATIPNPRDAEEQVRNAVQPTGQVEIKALRELSKDEIAAHGLAHGTVFYAPLDGRT